MKVKVESRDERSLILYLETVAVDGSGLIDGRRMNAEDFRIAKEWNDAGFIKFGRVPFNEIRGNLTNYVVMTDEALAAAHAERIARIKRNPCKYPKTEE